MVVSGTQLEEEEEDRRRATKFATEVATLIEQHSLWTKGPLVDDEDKLILDILREVLRYPPPRPPTELAAIDQDTRFEVTVPVGHEARMVIVAQVPDPEVTAMAVIRTVLEGLPPDGRRRVVDWAWARWHGDHDG